MQNNITKPEESPSTLKKIYTSGVYLKKHPHWHVEESPWKAQQIMRMLMQHHITPSTVCEIGCGAGEILRQLQDKLDEKCMFWGYDISPQAIDMAQGRANELLQFKLADIQQEQGKHFDLILVMDVLEHIEDRFGFLYNIKPKAEYKIFHVSLTVSVQTVLRKDGLLKVREEYGIVNYFTKETLFQTLKDAGYKIIDHFYTTGCTDLPTHEFKRKLMKYPRKLLFALNQDFTSRVLGGYRLLVLTK